MKKGQISFLTILATVIAFAIGMIFIITMTGIFEPGKILSPSKMTIQSSIETPSTYRLTISQMSFIRSEYNGKKISQIATDLHEKRDKESSEALTNAAKEYVKIYDTECVTLELWDNERNRIWQGPISEGCKNTGTMALLNPRYKIEAIIPTEDPKSPITLTQLTAT